MDRLREDTLAAIDAVFDRFSARAVVPGFAWGIVADGALVHAGGSGTRRVGEDLRPDDDSVFRIASMTKSFTAATVLLLRDDGLLGLDDPVPRHVPDVDLRGPTADAPPITIRHLLTMSAGLPTDDPWGDRQQGLDLRPRSPSCCAAGSASPGRRGRGSSTRTSATGSSAGS